MTRHPTTEGNDLEPASIRITEPQSDKNVIEVPGGSMAVPVVDDTEEVDDPGPGQIVRVTGSGSQPEGLHQWNGQNWIRGASTIRDAILPGLNDDFAGSVTYASFGGGTHTITISPAIFDRYVLELQDPSGDTAYDITERRFYYQGDLIYTDTDTIDFQTVDSYDSGDLGEVIAADTIELDHDVPVSGVGGTLDLTPDTEPLFPHLH